MPAAKKKKKGKGNCVQIAKDGQVHFRRQSLIICHGKIYAKKKISCQWLQSFRQKQKELN